MLRCLRHVVRIDEPLRAVGEQIAELKFAESCQRQIEAAEIQFAELERKELAVPTRVQRQLIVGDHIVEFFAYGISRSIGQRST